MKTRKTFWTVDDKLFPVKKWIQMSDKFITVKNVLFVVRYMEVYRFFKTRKQAKVFGLMELMKRRDEKADELEEIENSIYELDREK